MIVIADSSALIAIATYRGLHLLEPLFSDIVIPQAVYDEICVQGKPQADNLKTHFADKVATVCAKNYHLFHNIKGLGLGEQAAIQLYKALSAQLLLIDDQRAKKVAYANGLETMGSLGVLLLAKQQGLLSQIKPHISLLKTSNLYINANLLDQVLHQANED